MNIFEKKLGQGNIPSLSVHPVELFHSLLHQEGYEYLRGVQEEILSHWHANRQTRDVVGKMNTGAGKTLTGLLMLYSKLIEGYGPALYVCPDNQLVDQVIDQAHNYGIPACVFDASGDYPSEFLNKQSVLVCNFDKLFNGKSIFVRDNIHLGSVLLDDAHTGVRRVRQNATITIPHSHPLFKRLLFLFQEDLEYQAPGTFARVSDEDPSPRVLMRVPYWAWVSKHDHVVRMINEYRTDDVIDFAWQLIADDLLQCDCILSSKELEIAPIHVPYHLNPPFNEAKHRFVLSATFEDNSDLLKDLGISSNSALNALVPKDRKDIGERLILAPSRFDPVLNDEVVRNLLAEYTRSHKVNTVVLVPSRFQADKWRKLGAVIVDKTNIVDALATLKRAQGNLMVFVNRYDGVDLPGDMCRILVLDGRPSDHSLRDRYLNSVLADSSTLNAKLAQTIEQGLGRAVRSGSDYSVVFILGAELVRFLGVHSNYQYFAPVTASQLSLGLQLLDGEDRSDTAQTIVDVVGLCLSRDVSWRKYHQNAITSVNQNVSTSRDLSNLDTAKAEAKAIQLYRQRNYEAASQQIVSLIDERKSELSDRELGWYYQFAAQLLFPGNQVRSNDLQIKAAETTTGLFHPPHGPVFTRITRPGVQSAIIRRQVAEFERPQDVSVYLESILIDLHYNPDIPSEYFESNLANVGRFLGFGAQEPERELGKGPDVLWCMTDGHYLILEAKSRATHDKISKANLAQLYHSEQWFQEHYGTDTKYTLVTLQPPSSKEDDVTVSERVRVLDQKGLEDLRVNLRGLVRALGTKQPAAHTETEIQRLIIFHNLSAELFRKRYLKQIR